MNSMTLRNVRIALQSGWHAPSIVSAYGVTYADVAMVREKFGIPAPPPRTQDTAEGLERAARKLIEQGYDPKVVAANFGEFCSD